MPATKKTPTQEFRDLELHEQIRSAQSVARFQLEAAIRGFDAGDIVGQVANVLGVPPFASDLSESEHRTLKGALEAARSIGLALGLMLRPDAVVGER